MRRKLLHSAAVVMAAVGLAATLAAPSASAALQLPNRATFGLDAATWKLPAEGVSQETLDGNFCTIGTTCPVRVWSKSYGETLGLTVIAAGRTARAPAANQRLAQAVIETNSTMADNGLPRLKWTRGTLKRTTWRLGTVVVPAAGEADSAKTRIRALVAVRGNRLMTVLIIQPAAFIASPIRMIRVVARSLGNATQLPIMTGQVRGLLGFDK